VHSKERKKERWFTENKTKILSNWVEGVGDLLVGSKEEKKEHWFQKNQKWRISLNCLEGVGHLDKYL